MSKINLSRSREVVVSREVAVLRLDRHEFTKGEPVVIYYKSGNDIDYIFAIGTGNGIGLYKIVTTGQQDIVYSVETLPPDISTLVNGEVRLYHDTQADEWYTVTIETLPDTGEVVRKFDPMSSVPKIFIDLEDNSIWVSDEDRKVRRINSIYSKKEIDTMISEIKKSIVLTTLSYSQFKGLIEDGALVPGMYYQVKDYRSTVSLENLMVREIGNAYTLLIHAISNDDVDENGIAIVQDSNAAFPDTFTIKFSLNKHGECTWSSDPVIFWMRDMNGNEAPYDYRNILFRLDGDEEGVWHEAFGGYGFYYDCVINSMNKTYDAGTFPVRDFPFIGLNVSEESYMDAAIYHVSVDAGVRNKIIDVSSLRDNRYEVRISLRSDGNIVMYCPADFIDNVIN